jgi:rhodanese-related sulfurtransferase
VYVLWNGTRGWLLEGLALEHGASRFAGPPSLKARERARERARTIVERAGIQSIDRATLNQWRDDTTRTTYLFDVRDREEYEAGHLAGARNAAEGSLVMSPDHHFGTQNARCVLVDDDTVRATIVALWLLQMGRLEPYVLDDRCLDGALTETGPESREVLWLDRSPNTTITPQTLEELARDGKPMIVDVGHSEAYVRSHVPGARWCLRSALAETLAAMTESSSPIVLTSEDGAMARLASGDLAELGIKDVLVLESGNTAWCAAGLPQASGPTHLLSPRDDFWLASSERPGDERENVIAYLDWETSLLEDIERGGFVPFQNRLWV